MLARNQSKIIEEQGTILFRSSNDIDSPIHRIRGVNAVPFGIGEDENIITYNVQDETLFVETQTRYYFIKYTFDTEAEKDAMSILYAYPERKPFFLELGLFTATNIIYNEKERAYYILATRGVETSVFVWLIKFDAVNERMIIVYDPVNNNPPEDYIYYEDGIKTINDLLKSELEEIENKVNPQENFVHNLSEIDWDNFTYSFSYNNKLEKFLMTYVLPNEAGEPQIYEHKFKVVNNTLIQDSLVSKVYKLDRKSSPEEQITAEMELTGDPSKFGQAGEKIGTVTLDGYEGDKNPEMCFIVFDPSSGFFYSDTVSLTKNEDGGYDWITPEGKEWNNKLTEPNIYNIQFYIKIGENNFIQMAQDNGYYFLSSLYDNTLSITTKETSLVSLEGNYDRYSATFEDTVTLIMLDKTTGEVLNEMDVTERCKWYVQYNKPLYDDTFIGEVDYVRTATVTSCEVAGVDSYPESVYSFSHPEKVTIEIKEPPYRINYGNDYWDLRLVLDPDYKLSITPVGDYGDKVHVMDRLKNAVRCEYDNDIKELVLKAKVNVFGKVSNELTITVPYQSRPDAKVTLEFGDIENDEYITGNVTYNVTWDKETRIFLVADGIYYPKSTNSGQQTLKLKWRDTEEPHSIYVELIPTEEAEMVEEFSFVSKDIKPVTKFETEPMRYTFGYSYDNQMVITGDINNSNKKFTTVNVKKYIPKK